MSLKKLSLFSLYVLFGTITAFAQRVINVPSNSSTIQGAIDQAVNGDTVLVGPGIYSENLDFHGKAIIVTSGAKSYTEAAATVLNGVGVVPTVSLVTGESKASVLNGFTIQNGSSAAVLIQSSATVTNNAIVNNTNCAVVVYGASSSPLISGNRIAGTLFTTSTCGTPDRAAYSGVAVNIDSAGDVTLADNLIENNQASPRTGIVGGAILSEFNKSITLVGNVIRNNIGAAAVVFFSLDDAKVTAVQNLAYGNLARTTDATSGAYAAGGSPGISMTVYSQPSASFTFINNTIVRNYSYGNQSNQENGQFELGENVQSPRPVTLTTENNIIGGDTAQQAASCSLSSSSTIVWSHNDVYGASSSAGAPGCTPANATAAGNITGNPSFADPDNGDFHTQRTSPVVAAGDIRAPIIPPDDLDQRNRTVCGTIDMGVYEIHPIPLVSLSASPNPSAGGTSVTFTATVADNCNFPTGVLTFYDGATVLGTATLNSAGSTIFSTAALTVGTHTITAGYPGDFNFDPSTSAPVQQVVTGYPTATMLQASPNPAKALQAISLSATVTSQFGTPGGTVSFYAGATLLGSATLNGSGQAVLSTVVLGAGQYALMAVYNSTTQFASSTSPVVTEVVQGAATTTTLVSTPNPSASGKIVGFVVSVNAPGSTGVPVGTVDLMEGSNVLASVPLNTSGAASFSIGFLPVGAHSLVASYRGSANDNGSSSPVLVQIVVPAPVSVALTSSLNPANTGQTVTFVATVTSVVQGTLPGGSIVFADQFGTLASVLVSNGQALFSTSTLAVGTHNITASFTSSSGNFAGAASPPLAEVVQAFDFAMSVSSSDLTIPSGGYQMLQVTLNPIGGFNHAVQLGCNSVPANAQCVFSPGTAASLASGPQVVQLVVNTDQLFEYGKRVSTRTPPDLPGSRTPLLLAALLAPLTLVRGKRRLLRCGSLSVLLATLLLLGAVGCSGKLPGSTPPGAYTLFLTGTDTTAGTLQSHTVPVSLTVK